MPRFRVPDYIRTTFAVSDWRAFRLCGMDEVGRGAYAGPLVAAAVVLPQRFRHPLLRDSKLLTAKQRELVGAVLRERAVAWAVAEVSVDDINARGLGWANVEIFRRLVDAVDADGYCCDGNLRIPVSRPLHSLVAGDRKVPAVSAASIIAKVHRDALMTRMHDDAPHYNWASNKGYGAPEHRAAIREYGPHPAHRRVFLASVMQTELDLTGPLLSAPSRSPAWEPADPRSVGAAAAAAAAASAATAHPRGNSSDPEPAWTATRLISGMLARLSQLGQTAATSRSAIGRSNSNTAEQSLQRYSYRGIGTSVRTISAI